jgi:Leucine-rich repeat (LRR) protein
LPFIATRTGRFLSISLNFGLSGNIPNGLGALTQLTSLSLSLNPGVGGNIPVSFSALTNLQFLDLSGCALRGTVPTGLANGLKSISTVNIADNRLGGSLPSTFGVWRGVYVMPT